MSKTKKRTTKPEWTNTHVYLRTEQLERVRQKARESDRTIQAVIRRALDFYLDHEGQMGINE